VVHLSVCIRRAAGVSLALAALAPAVASAAVRHTTPAATATAGTCSAALPCRIDHAVNAASDGDEVVVAPGTYAITIPLEAPAIDLHGVAGQPAPLLAGDINLAGDVLSFEGGGTLRHLALSADSPAQDALSLQAGQAEDLSIVAHSGDGAKVQTAANPTVLRDSVIVYEDSRSGGAALKLREGSAGAYSLALRNVTALAPSATAIRCEVRAPQTATLVNVIARGAVADVDAANGGTGCSADHSALRPAQSPSLSLVAGIVTADPLLGTDHRPLAGSPTVDAGVADTLTSTTDPDGRPRTVPDIGAFEAAGDGPGPDQDQDGDDQGEDGDAPAPTASPEPTVEPPVEPPVRGVPAPVLGDTVVVAPGQGKVLVRRPGARRFRKLAGAALLPSGTVVDARRGRIRLTTALDKAGTFQTGRFWGARFRVRQSGSGNGMTSLSLRGGSFGRCPARSSALARASVVPRENPTSRRVVRRLWARDRGGRFRTYGNNSVATARGTAWTTEDRCDGTVTRVREGAVAVRNRRTGRTVLVRAGGSYLARR
jgi:hypothetical protein